MLDTGRVRFLQLRDKLVLLSFYRTTAVQVAQEAMQTLKSVYDQFGAHERFAMLGMFSNEQHILLDRKLIELARLSWPHALVGEAVRNRTHIAYDVPGDDWPWNVLVGPSGHIVAIGARGEALIDTIATLLVANEVGNF